MTAYIIILIIAAISLGLLIYKKSCKYSVCVIFIKAFVSSLFLLVSFLAAGLQRAGLTGSLFGATDTAGIFTFMVMPGLLFGLFGDIWLDLKYVHSAENVSYTYAGFFSFLIGHIFYIVGLIWRFADGGRILYVIIPLSLGVLVGVVIGLTGKPMKLDYGRYKWIVMLYGSFLAGMTLLAGSLAMMHSWQCQTLNIMFAGGVLFLISDLVLSQMYFGTGKEQKAAYIAANLITYYAAQFLIASCLLKLI